MPLKLYYHLLSQPSRAVFIFLKACNIPFESNVICLSKAEHMTPEYLKIHRFMKVPAIEHNGFVLTESIGIMRYLCREINVPEHWYPKSHRDQAKIDEYLEWQHLNTRLFCAGYFLTKFFIPIMKEREPREKKVKDYEEKISNCLDQIENIWLKDNKYLTGNNITIADLFGACEVEQPKMAGYDPCLGRPRLASWLDRVASETSPHYAKSHELLNKIAKECQGKPPSNMDAYNSQFESESQNL